MTPSPRRGRVRHHLRETFAWRESQLSPWHGTKFALDTGVPALAGLLLGHPELGFIGALAGSLFSFSDAPAPLPTRLLRLLETTSAVVIFGILGFWLGLQSPMFWALLVMLVFATGWLQLSSHSLTSPLRWSAISLVSMACLPTATWTLAEMVVFAGAVNALTQWFGSRFFPEAAPILPPPIENEPRSTAAATRFSLVYTAAAVIALLWGQQRGVSHPMWIATTVLLVIQPDARSSLTRILQRTLGTVVGVAAAALTVGFFHSPWTLLVAIIVLSYALPHAATRNYWLQTALFAWLILMFYDFASITHFNSHLITERLLDVTMGCILAVGATILAFTPLPSMRPKP